jgi:outer membrane protein assembly factor BamB
MNRTVLLFFVFTFNFISNIGQSQTIMYGNDPKHTGEYLSPLPSGFTFKKVWTFKAQDMIISSAVVMNDVIYFGSDDGYLYALHTNGKLKWKYRTNGMIRSTPAVKDNVTYINNYGGMFYAIDNHTGKELWSYKTEGERPRTGKGLNWCNPKDRVITDPWDFFTSSPVIVDTVVYFGSGTNMYAMNLSNHQLVWKFKAPDVIHSTPAVFDKMIYFGCWDSKLYALNVLNGNMVWSFETGTDPENHGMEGIQSSPSVLDTMVFIGSRDANVYAVHAKTGKKIWMCRFGGTWMPSAFAYDHYTLYTGSSEGIGLQALDITNGTNKYSVSNGFFFTFASPVVSGDIVMIGCMNGSLFAVNVLTKTIISRFDTNGRTENLNNTVLDNGTFNPEVFNPVSGASYEEAAEYTKRVLSAGSILTTPALDKNKMVYFGSTDHCFYALECL